MLAIRMSGKYNPQPLNRDLLVSKAWLQAVAIVVLFGFFILGFLAYRTYTLESPRRDGPPGFWPS